MAAFDKLKEKLDFYIEIGEGEEQKEIVFGPNYQFLKDELTDVTIEDLWKCQDTLKDQRIEAGLKEEINKALEELIDTMLIARLAESEEKTNLSKVPRINEIIAKSKEYKESHVGGAGYAVGAYGASGGAGHAVYSWSHDTAAHSTVHTGFSHEDLEVPSEARLLENRVTKSDQYDFMKIVQSEEVSDTFKTGQEYDGNAITLLLLDHFKDNDRVKVLSQALQVRMGERDSYKEELVKSLHDLQNGEILIHPILKTEGTANHWVAAVITKNSDKIDIVIADSMFNSIIDGTHQKHPLIADLKQILYEEPSYSKANVKFHNIGIYQQDNDVDCGAWLVDNSTQITNSLLNRNTGRMTTADIKEQCSLLNDTNENSVVRMRKGSELGLNLRNVHLHQFNGIMGHTQKSINADMVELESSRTNRSSPSSASTPYDMESSTSIGSRDFRGSRSPSPVLKKQPVEAKPGFFRSLANRFGL